ncbi:MAG: NAD+ synthase [Candidatus Nanopelagicales bacterium]|nr:NAD+ synthase [Candidatus Nanopelagicales bacterium]
MPQLRIALAQVNPTVGDLAGNVELVVARTREALAGGAHLVAFPEMVLTGYPIEDLALRWSFQRASITALDGLAQRLAAEGLGEACVIVGYLDLRDGGRDHPIGVPRGAPINAAAVLHRGQVVARYAKHHLPNYGVFDEFRYFVSGSEPCVVRLHGVDVALAICEDLWQDGGPVAQVRAVGAGLLVVINGSPYELHKDDTRLALAARRAVEGGAALAYVNMVGGQDELVFDGDSLVVGPDGALLARAPQFEQALLVVDLDLPAARGACTTVISADPLPRYDPLPLAPIEPRLVDEAEMYAALVVGLRDYVRKNGFRSVTFGFSGGIDSALVATIAADALGGANVHGLSMPSRYSSQHSQDDAFDLARRLGAHCRLVPIGPMFDAYMEALALTGLAEENLQARIRGTTVMAVSNQEGHLVLAPGNKSELSVGYSTIYGDAVGGFGPIKDVPKTWVYRLARWRNAQAEAQGEEPPIPPGSIEKPPSAELRPGQQDTDSLPPYDLLDDLLDDYVERDRGAAELVADGYDPALVERVLRMTDLAEYKRRQYPIGTKITPRSFGRDRRQPITNRWRETAGG